MKKTLLLTAFLAVSVASAFSQGQILFNNLIGGSTATSIRAPIFGVDPANPFEMKTGQSGAANSFPLGTTVYGGALLEGTAFTAELWARGTDGTFRAVAGTQVGFRTGAAAGYFAQGITAVIDGVAANSIATLQVRAWDTRTGNSWDSANVRGESTVFESLPLGGGVVAAPNLVGMTSFQLYQVVPEPSVIALGLLGLGGVFLFRRKK